MHIVSCFILATRIVQTRKEKIIIELMSSSRIALSVDVDTDYAGVLATVVFHCHVPHCDFNWINFLVT